MRSKITFTHLPGTGILVAIDKRGNKLYKAIGIARALGYKRPDAAVKRICKSTVTLVAPTFNQYGGRYDQPVKFIDEDDVILMLSRSVLNLSAKMSKELGKKIPAIKVVKKTTPKSAKEAKANASEYKEPFKKFSLEATCVECDIALESAANFMPSVEKPILYAISL